MKFLLLSILLISGQSFASDLSNQFGIGANIGYPIPSFGNAFNTANNPKIAAGIHGRYHLNSSLGFELGYERVSFKKTSLKLNNGNFLALYRTAGASDFTFILGAGLGLTKISNYTPKSSKLSALLRVGLEQNLRPSLTLGLYANYQYVSKLLGNMQNGRAHVITPNLALTWYFGSNKVQSVIEDNKELDSMKKDLQAEANKKVNDAKTEVNTQLGSKNNTDSDNDGVVDSEDKCPSTKSSEKVNEFGCALAQKAEIKINVEFSTGKTEVSPEYQDQLVEVSDFLKKYKDVKVQIEGYTDNTGSSLTNTKLSQKRADAVMNSLVKLGIEKSRLSAKGFGPKNPIADNNTAEGKQKNRRVMAVIKSEK